MFAVVVSSKPLPAYSVWRAARNPSPWGKHETPRGVVWLDDGAWVDALTERGTERGERGKERAQIAGGGCRTGRV